MSKGSHPTPKSFIPMMSPESLASDGRGGFVDHAAAVREQQACRESRGPVGMPENPARYDDHPFEPGSDVKSRVRSYIRQTRVQRQIAALKEWRDASGSRSMKRAALDDTIAAIVRANPATMEDLITVPGVSEMLADIAGNQLLEILRKT